MLYSFARITLRHFARHKVRTLLTIMGVAIGIAAIIGMWLVESAASHEFTRTVDEIAGRAKLEVVNGQIGVPEELLDQIRAVPGVTVAAPTVQGFLTAPELGGERLYIMGIDLLADETVRDYQFDSSRGGASFADPLVFLAKRDAIAPTSEFLRHYRLKIGDSLQLQTSVGFVRTTIRGSLSVRKGPARVFGGRLALMDVFAAERLFGLDHRYTQIGIVPTPGVNIESLEKAVEKVVGGRAIVQRPSSRSAQFERQLSGFSSAYTFAGAIAVAIAIYLIFNTMMISVTQRRREIGILRAIGMRRKDLLALVASEAVIVGLIGSVGGIVIGIGFAEGLLRVFNSIDLTRGVGGVPAAAAAEAIAQPAVMLWALGLGVASALLAALLPARDAANVKPVESMRWLQTPVATRSRHGLAITGVCSVVLSVVLYDLGARALLDAKLTAFASQVVLLVGASLIAPDVVSALANWADAKLALGTSPIAALACRTLVTDTRRVAVTSAALAMAVAGAIGMATILTSVNADIDHQLDLGFSGIDLLIASPAGKFDPSSSNNLLPLAASLGDEIAAVPGVARVSRERWIEIPYAGAPTNVVANDVQLRRWEVLEGRHADFRKREITVGEQVARRTGLHPGDTITLMAPAGAVRLRVVGIGYDASNIGWIGMDRELYQQIWKDDRINQIVLTLKPGASIQTVSDEIRRRFGARYGLTILQTRSFENEAKAALRSATFGAYPINAMALSIALIGVINSLIALIMGRTREIGTLRATAATRTQVISVVVIEAATIGIAATAIGVLAGSLDGILYMRGVFPALFNHTPLYAYPTGAAVFTFIAAIALSALAGYFPGRTAARLKIVEALSYE